MNRDKNRKRSQQQADSNRRNAQKSTGPRTPEGKAASSRNGLTHGLSGDKHFILEGEDPEAFLRLLQDLHDHLRPVGDSEELAVKRIAAAQWRLDRAFALESGIYREESTILVRFDRKRQSDHEFYMKRDGKDSNAPNPHEPEDLLARAFMEQGKGPDHFTRLVRYETAIERSIERGMKHLKALQAARSAQTPAVPEAPHAPEPPAPEPPNPPSTPSDSTNYEVNPEDPTMAQSSPTPPGYVTRQAPPSTNNDEQ